VESLATVDEVSFSTKLESYTCTASHTQTQWKDQTDAFGCFTPTPSIVDSDSKEERDL
jgi:hypothetical protein